jgi:ubiquinone/menaquinone biosynthesis C-methylase UbiE
MLQRTLEPELMDTSDDAREYDAMDHAAVNTIFANDLLRALAEWSLQRPVNSATIPLSILDLGAGTAQIPIELARRAPHIHITAVDAAEEMLVLARANINAAELSNRIELVQDDAKQLPFADASFDVVISNSIVHHIPNPREVIAQAIRVTKSGGLLFHRDLARPRVESELNHLVHTYAGTSTEYQRRLFAESLRAALTIEEVRDLVAASDFPRETVQMTSDRHWTWITIR